MKNQLTSNDQARDTGMALVLILLIITVLTKNNTYATWALPVMVLNMVCPSVYTPLAGLWFGLSHVMGEIVSKIFLTIVFFAIVTPVGKMRNWSGNDAMGLKKWKSGTDSVFTQRDHHVVAEDLERPF